MSREVWPPAYANVSIRVLLDEGIPHGAFRFYAKLRALAWSGPTLSIHLDRLMELTGLSHTRVYEYARLLRDRNELLFHCAQSVFECSFPAEQENPGNRELLNPSVKTQRTTSKTSQKTEDRNSRITGKREKPDLFPLAEAIADVCRMNLDANRGRIFSEAKRLLKAMPAPTPELIRQHYCGPGNFWQASDWRGKKGEKPTPAVIRETWGRWLDTEQSQPPSKIKYVE